MDFTCRPGLPDLPTALVSHVSAFSVYGEVPRGGGGGGFIFNLVFDY